MFGWRRCEHLTWRGRRVSRCKRLTRLLVRGRAYCGQHAAAVARRP